MRVSVICIGNELLLDDGVGPAVCRYINARYDFGEHAQVFDRACMGMAIVSDLRECDAVLVLDAVDVPDASPGDLFSFAPQDAAPTPPGATSLHDMRFADVIDSAALLGIQVEGHCFGIQVENRSPSEFIHALTPYVASALPLLAQAAVRYIRSTWAVEVIDRYASSDPGKAGTGLPCARDFSGRTGAIYDPEHVLPRVYGTPTCAPIARYLAQGLKAVGCECRLLPSHKESSTTQVLFNLNSDDSRVIEEIYRVQCNSSNEYIASVTPATTDYDCDALIGSCKQVLEQAKGNV